MNNTIMDKINGRPYGLRILYAALGLFIFAFGVYLTIQANVGLAPWDAFSMGVSYHVPLTWEYIWLRDFPADREMLCLSLWAKDLRNSLSAQ